MTTSIQSKLSGSSDEIVIDASVLINLLATGSSEAILKNLHRSVVITTEAYMEVRRDPLKDRPASEVIERLEEQGLLFRRDIELREGQEIFDFLTNDLPLVLGRGEAATIGLCQSLQLTAVIDDKQGRTVALDYSNIPNLIGTMDLLGYDKVYSGFSRGDYRKIILNAAEFGRMYFPPEWGEWVEKLLGVTVAKTIPGLAGYYKQKNLR